MKKKLENFQEILTVSKHSHSEVGFILVISLEPAGVGSMADRMGGGCQPPMGGASASGRGASAARGGRDVHPRGASEAPPVMPTLSLGRLVKWNKYQNGQGDCLMGVSQGTVFVRVQHRIWNSEIF